MNTATMGVFRRVVSEDLGEGDYAVLIMDQAGWQSGRKLVVPENITILFQTPCSPALNPVETLWGYLRRHCLSNRAFDTDDHLRDAGIEAWHDLTPERLRSVCACHGLTREM